MLINLPRKRLFWSVSLGHMVNDTFMSMVPVMLAFLSVAVLPMSNTQIGLTVSATQLMGAVSQPGFGILADRNGGRWLGAGGVAWTVSLFMLALVGAQTGYFWLMFIPFVMQAIGSGAFHPVGAMHASESDKKRAASNLSYFFLMGQFGLALGPALAGVLLDVANPAHYVIYMQPLIPIHTFIWTDNLAPIFLIGIMAIPTVSFMAMMIPASVHHKHEKSKTPTKKITRADLPLRAFAILGVMVAFRSLGQPGSVTFIPVLFQNKGWSPTEYGAITSFFWFGSGIAGVMFGNLADRYDRRWVVGWSIIASAPAFFLLPGADGGTAILVAIIAGALSGGSHSIIVLLAQELIPAAKGFASGAILGFIFGTGALGSALIGGVSDQIGLDTTFQIVSIVMVFAGFLAFLLPAKKVRLEAESES